LTSPFNPITFFQRRKKGNLLNPSFFRREAMGEAMAQRPGEEEVEVIKVTETVGLVDIPTGVGDEVVQRRHLGIVSLPRQAVLSEA